MNYPKYVRFENDDRSSPNYILSYIGNAKYQKTYGGWTIKVKYVNGKIVCHPDQSQTMHLKGVVLVKCTKEEVEKDKDYI